MHTNWTDIRCTRILTVFCREKKVLHFEKYHSFIQMSIVKVIVTQGAPHHHLNFPYIVQILYCQVYIPSPHPVWNCAMSACLHNMNMAEEHGTWCPWLSNHGKITELSERMWQVWFNILVNNQLDALFQCTYLFHCSTCFEQPSAHHQENQLYQYIVHYVSLCVGDSLVCWSGGNSWPAYKTVTYTEWYIPDDVLIQLILLMMSTGLLETRRAVK